MEKYRELEYDLASCIEDTYCLDGKFQLYRESVNKYINHLLDETVEINELRNKLKEKDVEMQRLNNIIEELEKWLKEKQNLTCGCGITPEYIYAYENCLDKLQELKEGK